MAVDTVKCFVSLSPIYWLTMSLGFDFGIGFGEKYHQHKSDASTTANVSLASQDSLLCFFFSIGFDKNTDSLVVCDLCKPVQFSEKVESKKLTTIENPKGERHKVQSSFIAQCVLCCHVTTIFFYFRYFFRWNLKLLRYFFCAVP